MVVVAVVYYSFPSHSDSLDFVMNGIPLLVLGQEELGLQSKDQVRIDAVPPLTFDFWCLVV